MTTKLPRILYSGSVKNVRGESNQDSLVFEYTDKYSIFDWGEMPDHFEKKGQCLAIMADLFFKVLGNPNQWRNEVEWQKYPQENMKRLSSSKLWSDLLTKGLEHHSCGLVDEQMEALDTANQSSLLKVKSVDVIRPKEVSKDSKLLWDYSCFIKRVSNTLVPLEVIFRFGVPTGSSLLKRVENNPTYLKERGIDFNISDGQKFDWPMLEFTTKLEPTDRFLTLKEAQEISGLSDREFETLQDNATAVALKLKNIFSNIDVELWDGKLEFAFANEKEVSDRSFQLVDSIGPDELRLTYNGVQLSKEIFRQYYKESDWAKNVNLAKTKAQDIGVSHWKGICVKEMNSFPESLPENYKVFGENMYMVLTNQLALEMGYERPFQLDMDLKTLLEQWKKL